jgi:site-specific DNA recombinase
MWASSTTRARANPGEHAPIVTPALFDAVQERLTSNGTGARVKRAASGALLIGRIFDDRDNRMTPSMAKKRNIRYRYYVSSVLAQGRKSEAGAIARVSSSEIEAVIVDALRASYPDDAGFDDRALIQARLERVVLRAGSILIHGSSEAASPWAGSSRSASPASGTASRFSFSPHSGATGAWRMAFAWGCL